MKKFILHAIIYLFVTITGLLTVTIGLLQITEYRPFDKEILHTNENGDTLYVGKRYNIISWNIGYSGLGDDMDFFYDGGTKVRTTLSRTRQNLDSIKFWLKSNVADFYILQEVDFNSKRTYYINQLDRIIKEFDNNDSYQCCNYKIRYLPFPVTNPLGRIESGLVGFSKIKALEYVRHAYLSRNNWPKRLWMPDRAFVSAKYHVYNNKYLFIINTHNTAFDDGSIREKETKQIAKYSIDLYNMGHYVIIAGDWNQTPTIPSKENRKSALTYSVRQINLEHFPSEWKIAYDSTAPTNRSLETSNSQEWHTFIIDFAISSPNIDSVHVKTKSLDFRFSDHNPINISFYLKN